jgi:hypothetical protein
MLVAKNSDGAAAAEQLDNFTKTLTAFKDLKAKTSPGGANMLVNKRVLQPLINGRFARVRNNVREQLSGELPQPDVTEQEDEWLLSAKGIFEMFKIY